MKQKRLYPSDIVIPAVAAGLIALLLTQWRALPHRVTPGGLFEGVQLWPREEEEELRLLSETTQPKEWLSCALRLADVYSISGRYEEEEALLEKCLALIDRYLGQETRSTLDEVRALADLYRVRGRAAKALPLQLRLLRQARKDNRNLDGFYRELLVETAASQRAVGLHADAAASLRRALVAKVPGEATAYTRGTADWKKWLQEYREVLSLTGKQPEEIARIIHDEFGL